MLTTPSHSKYIQGKTLTNNLYKSIAFQIKIIKYFESSFHGESSNIYDLSYIVNQCNYFIYSWSMLNQKFDWQES